MVLALGRQLAHCLAESCTLEPLQLEALRKAHVERVDSRLRVFPAKERLPRAVGADIVRADSCIGQTRAWAATEDSQWLVRQVRVARAMGGFEGGDAS